MPVLILLGVAVLAVCCLVWRRRHRRRIRRGAAATMFVATFPTIELTQPYGGWNADAYDAGTGRGAPLARSTWTIGPPSTWGRLP